MWKALLQGRPLGHPLHPLLVHFPIGLFVLSLLLDLAGYLTGGQGATAAGAYYTMLLGVLSALVAVGPGLADWWDIRPDHPARKTATYHMLLNFWAVSLYIVNVVLRHGASLEGTTPRGPFLLSLAGVGLLAVSGYLGGTLVYDDGVAVGRAREPHPAPRATVRVPLTAARDGLLPVGEVASLPDRRTLRAEVAGDIVTLVNLGGSFYAFQEFCTHRYGPLSEGQFQDHQVMCPWHRSCFDVRTGQVTQGPAKVDLRVYEVVVRDGTIWLRLPPAALSSGK